MKVSLTLATCRGATSRICGALIFAAILTGATSSEASRERVRPGPSTEAAKAELIGSLLALNNLVEAIRHDDACRGKSNIDALDPLQDRIAHARLRAAKLLPEQASTIDTGDSDWECDRSRHDRAISPSALKTQAGRSIDRLEAALEGLQGEGGGR